MPPLIIQDSYFKVEDTVAPIVNRRSSFEIISSHFVGNISNSRKGPIIRCSECRMNKVQFNSFLSLSVSSILEINHEGTWLHEPPSFTI